MSLIVYLSKNIEMSVELNNFNPEKKIGQTLLYLREYLLDIYLNAITLATCDHGRIKY